MKTTRLTRVAISGAAAALCLGVTVPALACTTGGAGATDAASVHQLPEPTLAQEQAWVDSFVAHRTAWLDALAAAAAANTNLTAAQQAAVMDGVAKAKTALADLQTAVDAATSTQQVQSILAQAMASMPFPVWPHVVGRHHQFKPDRVKAHNHHRDLAGKDQVGKASPTDVTLTSARRDAGRRVDAAWSQAHSGWHRDHTDGPGFGARHFGPGGAHAGSFGGHGGWGR